jgi:hypothetical protein
MIFEKGEIDILLLTKQYERNEKKKSFVLSIAADAAPRGFAMRGYIGKGTSELNLFENGHGQVTVAAKYCLTHHGIPAVSPGLARPGDALAAASSQFESGNIPLAEVRELPVLPDADPGLNCGRARFRRVLCREKSEIGSVLCVL